MKRKKSDCFIVEYRIRDMSVSCQYRYNKGITKCVHILCSILNENLELYVIWLNSGIIKNYSAEEEGCELL